MQWREKSEEEFRAHWQRLRARLHRVAVEARRHPCRSANADLKTQVQ
jgi:hypothetical protein